MKIVSAEQMNNLDKKTINEFGIPSLVLMERASLGVVDIIHKNFNNQKKILVICGTGNNGGDGLAISRLLYPKYPEINLVLIGEDSKKTEENKHQLELIKKLGIKYFNYSEENVENIFESADLIIDAIFGIGLKRNIEGIYKDIIEQINISKAIKIAVDIPSGINSDTGEVLGSAVKADITVTFGLIKAGLLMDQSLEYVGNLHVVDIGIPKIYSENINVHYIDKEYIYKISPSERKINSFKNTYGRTVIIGGSESMSGAVVLAVKSALKTGSGLVNLIVPEAIHNIVSGQIPTAMASKYKDDNFIEVIKEQIENKAGGIVFGPGAGKSDNSKLILKYLFKNFKNNLVVDADGLNILSENMDLLKERIYPLILTPHVGEMARLMGLSTKEIQKDRLKTIKDFKIKYPDPNIIIVFKGAKTIISDGSNIFINSTGNPILARGGSGDILSGIIGSFVSQNISPINSAILGVYLHGLMGDLALEKFDENSVITEELIDFISPAFKLLKQNK